MPSPWASSCRKIQAPSASTSVSTCANRSNEAVFTVWHAHKPLRTISSCVFHKRQWSCKRAALKTRSNLKIAVGNLATHFRQFFSDQSERIDKVCFNGCQHALQKRTGKRTGDCRRKSGIAALTHTPSTLRGTRLHRACRHGSHLRGRWGGVANFNGESNHTRPGTTTVASRVGLGAYGERPRKPHIYNLATPSLPAASNGLSCHSILWISISGSSLWRSVKDCPRSNLWSGSWLRPRFRQSMENAREEENTR